MKNIEETIWMLGEVGQTLRSLEEVRTLLLKLPIEAITEALVAVRAGWRLDYESRSCRDSDDYDGIGGTEEWCLSGPGLTESKWWYGEWDHRSYTDDMPRPAAVLRLAGIGTKRIRAEYGKEIVRALQALTAMFPKKE